MVCHRLLSPRLFQQWHSQNRSFLFLDELEDDCFEQYGVLLWDDERGETKADLMGSISKLSYADAASMSPIDEGLFVKIDEDNNKGSCTSGSSSFFIFHLKYVDINVKLININKLLSKDLEYSTYISHKSLNCYKIQDSVFNYIPSTK